MSTDANPRLALETQASTPSRNGAVSPRPEESKPHWKANLGLLTTCWSLAMIVLAGNITMASLATADILKQADWPQSLATLPLAVVYIGATMCVVPISKFMRYRGRRAGFVICGAVGVISAGVSLLATELARLGTVPPGICFALIILGALLLGVFDACMGFLRYAAAEERRSPMFTSHPYPCSLIPHATVACGALLASMPSTCGGGSQRSGCTAKCCIAPLHVARRVLSSRTSYRRC